jgi:hypothetical protein
MFGSPDWFRPKVIGWGLTPVRWQGWAYSLAWMSVISAPFVLLLSRGQIGESFAWLAVTMGGLIYDVRDILHKIRGATSGSPTSSANAPARPTEDVFYIGESGPGTATVATRNYSLKLK